MVTRLQFGTSRLENLPPEALEVFLDKSWIHLGDSKRQPLSLDRYSMSYVIQLLHPKVIKATLNKAASKFFDLVGFKQSKQQDDYYLKTNFQEFYYQKGDRLPWEDNSVDYIFSQHFFEHLFFDEAIALFQECYRILKPNGVIRTCVPDADLRTYAPPEPIGYPDIKLAWNHPSKHKTRWSVYSLSEAIRFSGFHVIPIYYCDKSGQHICNEPSVMQDIYQDCTDPDVVYSLQYITRIDSLIVDGIKT